MSLRKPATAKADTISQRMPFAAAEAMLWGPKVETEHQWLLSQMRQLQTEHDAYDSRIKTTEASAETAEAAVSRIRHVEQLVEAIQAVDNNKALQEWAKAEFAQLKVFVNDNKHVRQGQIELERNVSRIVDEVDELMSVMPSGLRSLLQRVHALETGRAEDFDRIKSLEREIADLKVSHHSSTTGAIGSPLDRYTKQLPATFMAPPMVQDGEVSDATTDTEDEALMPPQQLAMNPVLVTAPTKAQGFLSARQRLLKRPSIHNSKLPLPIDDEQQEVPALKPSPLLHPPRTTSPPLTQILSQSHRKKRKLPVEKSASQRVLRPRLNKAVATSAQPLVSDVSKDTSKQATQLISTDPRRRSKPTIVQSPVKIVFIDSTQISTADSPRKQQPQVVRPRKPAPLKNPDIGHTQKVSRRLAKAKSTTSRTKASTRKQADCGASEQPRQTAANLVKTSPRKVTAAPAGFSIHNEKVKYSGYYPRSSSRTLSPEKRNSSSIAGSSRARPAAQPREIIPDTLDLQTYYRQLAQQ